MAIKVFYFVAQMGDRWRDIMNEQMKTIAESGLLDAAEQIYVCQGGKARMKYPHKYKAVYFSDLDQYEYPALHMVKEYTKPDDIVLYIHTKGVSRKGTHAVAGDKWREYMMWGCVERWREHVEALKTHDVSGVQLTKLNPNYTGKCGADHVYAGNFWWSTGSYIQKLTPPEITKDDRFKAEGWIMRGAPKCHDLHNLTNGTMITTENTFSLPTFDRAVYDKSIVKYVETRHDIINAFIKKFGYKKYCEIGVEFFRCFRKVNCETKVCVDPAVPSATFPITSDDFFAQNKEKYDVFFIDGLHTKDQVYKDIINALACLNDGGTIIMHDCNPETEWEQRATDGYDGRGVWVGDVWKAFARLRMERNDLSMAMIDSDFGCGIIRKGKQKTYPKAELTYPFFVQNRKALMNVVDPEDFYGWLEGLK